METGFVLHVVFRGIFHSLNVTYQTRAAANRSIGMGRNEPFSPLFIIGAPRSGTTLLHRLCQDVLSYKGGIEGCIWQSVKALDDHLARVALELGADRVGTKGFSISRFTRRAVVEKYADALMSLHRAEYGPGPLIDKTPGAETISAAPLIKALLPAAKFIFLRRRGIENVMSQMRRFPDRPFESACFKWARPMQRWLEVRDGLEGHYIEVDQEGLYTNAHDVAQRLTRFLGVKSSFEIEEYLTTHFPEKTQSGKYGSYISLLNTGWDEFCAQKFHDICGDMMKSYGYNMHDGEGRIFFDGFIDLVASPHREHWKIEIGNPWIDLRGPGLLLHPNEPGHPASSIRFGGSLKRGSYTLDAEIIVFDSRCKPHTVTFSALEAAGSQDWTMELDGTHLGQVTWHVPVVNLDQSHDMRITVTLDPSSSDCSFSAIHLVSCVFSPIEAAEQSLKSEKPRFVPNHR